MKEQDQIRAIAELDELQLTTECDNCNGEGYYGTEQDHYKCGCVEGKVEPHYRRVPDYLHSRDAIIPVIEKWCTNDTTRSKFISSLYGVIDCHELPLSEMSESINEETFFILTATPPQLCEALLRATGKWKDE